MSSLSNLPYGKILDYWGEKLSGSPYRTKFLLTKGIEVISFRGHSNKQSNTSRYHDFPLPIQNKVPEEPTISIVIPVFIKTNKDLSDLRNLMKSLEHQTLNPNHIILIDDCSPVSYHYPNKVDFFRHSQNSGPAKARNFGKRIALDNQSHIIAFTDTDCILSENWIATIKATFQSEKSYQILSGNTISFDKHWFGTYHNINGTLNGRKIKDADRLLYGTTANLAITKDVGINLDFNDKFPLAAGEDIDFCFKANKSGYAIKHVPSMKVFHNYGYSKNPLDNIKRFRRQFKRYGKGEKILLQEIPEYYAYFDKTEEIPALK